MSFTQTGALPTANALIALFAEHITDQLATSQDLLMRNS
jgi:hypothetical protein